MDLSTVKDFWDKRPYTGHVAAYQPWVFAVGTLSYNPEHIVRKKVYKDLPFEPNWNMRTGTAIHEYIQRRLGNGWNHEQEIWLDIPYAWKSVNSNTLTLFGSIDSVDFTKHIIYEYKTSRAPDSGIQNYYKLQAAGYAKMCEQMYHSPFETHILKITLRDDENPIDYVLSAEELQSGWKELQKRALETADTIDRLLGELNQAKEAKKAGKK